MSGSNKNFPGGGGRGGESDDYSCLLGTGVEGGVRGKFLLIFFCKLKDFRLDFAGEARVCIPSAPVLHLFRSAHDSNFVTLFRFYKAYVFAKFIF